MAEPGPAYAALTSTDALTDDRLMRDVQAGDREAFRLLYERHESAALRAARAIVAEWAQEAVQEAFACVWFGCGKYRAGIGTVEAWLLKIVRRRALDLVRSESRRAHVCAEREVNSVLAAGCLEDDVIARNEGRALREALLRLPRPQREVIVLAYFSGFTGKQIAGRLHLPEGTVKGRMRLGLDKLRMAGASDEGVGLALPVRA
jgi:RNA polymerase sigma-70 factor (ECF subfamily)